LQALAEFFTSDQNVDANDRNAGNRKQAFDGNMLQEQLRKLHASFTLLKYRGLLADFISAMKGFRLDHLLSPDFFDLKDLIGSNFLIRSAIDLLNDLTRVLGGLEHHDLRIIGTLSTERELSVGLLLMFYKRHTTLESFDKAVEHAQNRAVGNAHAIKILLKLRRIRDLLQPFWDDLSIDSLTDIKEHFNQYVITGNDKQASTCGILEEFVNLIENWAECEIYFRDGADSGADSGDILRRVKIYLKSGRYVAAFKAQVGGASLGLSYQGSDTGDRKVLNFGTLQEHVQWAILSAADQGSVDSSLVWQRYLTSSSLFLSSYKALSSRSQTLIIHQKSNSYVNTSAERLLFLHHLVWTRTTGIMSLVLMDIMTRRRL
jgi:hypothetical protein